MHVDPQLTVIFKFYNFSCFQGPLEFIISNKSLLLSMFLYNDNLLTPQLHSFSDALVLASLMGPAVHTYIEMAKCEQLCYLDVPLPWYI